MMGDKFLTLRVRSLLHSTRPDQELFNELTVSALLRSIVKVLRASERELRQACLYRAL